VVVVAVELESPPLPGQAVSNAATEMAEIIFAKEFIDRPC
jgi:hypothetical protein